MVTTTTGLATSFITFTRTSNATVTDSNGFIKWAGHNLLTNSESFDASAWTKTNTTIAANAAVAPNGTTTADKLNETAVSFGKYVDQSFTSIAGATYTFGVFAKAAERRYVVLRVADGGGDLSSVFFDLDGAGAVVSGTGATITSVGSGWFLCTVAVTISTATTIWTRIWPSDNSSSTSYTGVAGSGILLWGAHLYRSDLGGMVLNPARGDAYYPTTPRNLIGYTEDFSVWNASAWQTDGILSFGSGSVSNAAIAPNGLQTADLITLTATNANHRIFANVPVVTSTKLLFACYAKANGYTKIGLREGGTAGAGAAFDLSGSGSVIGAYNVGGSTVGDMAITSVGNGWFRISCTIAFASASAMRFGIQILSPSYVAGTDLAATWTSDGTSGIYLWGAQLSDSASLDAYSPVYDAAVTSAAYYAPRLDYDANGSALGLLVEEQRTNFLLHSNAFDQTDWLKLAGGTGVAPVVTPNAGVSPDGTSTADRVQFDRGAGTTSADISRIFQDYTDPASGVATNSIWIKSYDGSSTYTMLLQNGSGSSTITVTGAWQRFVISSTSTSANFQLRLQGDLTPATADVLLAAAQSEYGSFATSYIPTGASTATRTADVASVSTQAFPYSATEGTVVVSATVIHTAVNNNRYIGFNLASSQLANRMIDVFKASPQYANYKSSDAQQTGFGVWQVNSKVGVVYKADDYVFVANGGTVVTDTSTSGLSTADTMVIGQLNGGNQLNGHIRQITYLPRRLPNADLIARTV